MIVDLDANIVTYLIEHLCGSINLNAVITWRGRIVHSPEPPAPDRFFQAR